jgi:hypothetical protein
MRFEVIASPDLMHAAMGDYYCDRHTAGAPLLLAFGRLRYPADHLTSSASPVRPLASKRLDQKRNSIDAGAHGFGGIRLLLSL